MVGRFASGCLLGAWLRFAEGRYAAGGAGGSGTTLWDTALVLTLLRDLRKLRRTVGLPAARRTGSLAIRHVDCGSCNGCEHELTLVSGPTVDMARYGLGIVASPRHADVLLITGPVTTRMRSALLTAYAAMPEPRRVAALGDCALGCGILGKDSEIVGPVGDVLPVDLLIPGCPPTPEEIASALLGLIDGSVRP